MSTDSGDFLYKEESYQLIGAAFEVYNELTCAYNEPLYQEAYELELKFQGIQFVAQPQLKVAYKGQILKKDFFADIIAFEKIILELKALPKLTSREESQLLNYLKAANLKVGLLINFGAHPKLEYKRIVL